MARTDRDKLFEKVKEYREKGWDISRTKARNELKWNDAKVNAALEENRDRIEVKTWNLLDLRPAKPSAVEYDEEKQLWKPICEALQANECAWLAKKRFSKVYPINTATRRGETLKHGKWSNPDITIIFIIALNI